MRRAPLELWLPSLLGFIACMVVAFILRINEVGLLITLVVGLGAYLIASLLTRWFLGR